MQDDFNAETFDTFLPWGEIPETNIVPNLDAILTLVDLKPSKSKNGKVNFTMTFRVKEPVKYEGVPIYQRFFVASDDVPNGVDKSQMDARMLQQVRINANIPVQVDTFRKLVAFIKANNPIVGGTVSKYFDDYMERDANKITDYWKPGSRVPAELTNSKPGAGKAAPARTQTPPAPVRPPAPPKAPERTRAAVPTTGNSFSTNSVDNKGFKITCPTCRESVDADKLQEHVKNCKPKVPETLEKDVGDEVDNG